VGVVLILVVTRLGPRTVLAEHPLCDLLGNRTSNFATFRHFASLRMPMRSRAQVMSLTMPPVALDQSAISAMSSTAIFLSCGIEKPCWNLTFATPPWARGSTNGVLVDDTSMCTHASPFLRTLPLPAMWFQSSCSALVRASRLRPLTGFAPASYGRRCSACPWLNALPSR
jgi:hypothetical protein